MTETTAWVSVARLIRPQGRRGEILAEILTDFPERFQGMQEAWIDRENGSPPARIEVEQTWLHKGRVVLKLAGVETISAAEVLRGAMVVLPASERMPLEPNSAYISDLIGCELENCAQPGSPVLGIISDVIRQETTADLLVLKDGRGAEHWIPFARAYLVGMDIAGRRLRMNLPPGLLDVNAPATAEERLAAEAAAGEQ